jgi:hypothetical protein
LPRSSRPVSCPSTAIASAKSTAWFWTRELLDSCTPATGLAVVMDQAAKGNYGNRGDSNYCTSVRDSLKQQPASMPVDGQHGTSRPRRCVQSTSTAFPARRRFDAQHRPYLFPSAPCCGQHSTAGGLFVGPHGCREPQRPSQIACFHSDHHRDLPSGPFLVLRKVLLRRPQVQMQMPKATQQRD